MKRYLMFTFLVSVLGLVFGCRSAPQGPSTEEMISAANALDQAIVAAFNRGDADAMASLYWDSPDVVFFPPDALLARGLAAIKAADAQSLKTMQGAKLELTESHQMRAGEVVIGWGLWRIRTPEPDGKTSEMVGRYTNLKAERDGKWVYLIDHASVPQLPPSAK